MLPVGWLVFAVVVAILLTLWVTFTVTRLDRLHARVDAAQAALDAQLVRRAAALLHVAQAADGGLAPERRRTYENIAQNALAGTLATRQAAENAVGRAVATLATDPRRLPDESERELREAAARVLIARRFYNDAVRDTRTLRARRMPRLLHLAGRRDMPQFFDIDDTPPVVREELPAVRNDAVSQPVDGRPVTRPVAPSSAPTDQPKESA
ncbi:MAG TPA: NUDIX hydrolase [Jatrophihabitantaceae bacterium]|nr:NUDIX hydrolase [Jatrophihabitantaceae bacterium]